ncbi:uncharacterized protein EV420DRAFT_1192487 [Desarmillaria tabescens]|uniref:Uncharacterized protein n=1 Tax=Armillaria tabescens TaxID=1929756 RepID=A0AA39NBE0_ARMTA|nr:uncharacterized protein EV420DRAFT_1192487 [Desarmillaria tabescens]KAK0462513.1 hypothetical protein EV420DRAFT_1192487 [Desarmillaria tabescens]
MLPFNSSISSAAEWPSEIKDLACLLDSPIPSQLVNGPCPVISSRASPVLEELRNSLADSPEQLTDSTSEVLDILDLLLSTVRTLRALSEDDMKQSTIPFWSLLIRSLALVCYDKSYAMQEAAFVRPRLSYARSFMEDGHASLLISHLVEDIQQPRPVVDDKASGRPSIITVERSNEESREEYDSETSYGDESLSNSTTSYERTEPSTDPTSAQSSHVPLDAHILAYWKHPNSVVLPYLCVTDEEDIFSLMCGVVYQRATWGISAPVIGIILSNTGFVGHVVLGWLDKERTDPDVLPEVRFAYGDETRTDASLGVYDLTDPVSALKFGQFIISLRAHVEGIVTQCQTPAFKRISWRSDTIDDDNCGSEEQWRQRIVSWLKTVERCCADHREPPEPSSTNCCSSTMADPERRATRTSSKSRSAPRPRRSMSADSKRKPHPAEDVGLPHTQEPSLGVAGSKTPSDRASAQPAERGRQEASTDGGSSNKGKTDKRSKSADALSCSALGAKSLAGISPTAKLSFSSYAHDRKIVSLSNIPIGPGATGKGIDARVHGEIDEMLKIYEDMTMYMKPPIKQNELPVVDKGVKEVLDHFLMQVGACHGDKNTPELPHLFWEVVLGRFSSILWASVGGYSKELAGKSPNEAEARHDWDALLNFGSMTAHELASGRVVLERAMLLSRNIAADTMKASPNSDGAEFKTFAAQIHKISLAADDAASISHSDLTSDDLLVQSADFIAVAAQHLSAVRSLFRNIKTARNAILKRAGDEPEVGIVDAILTVPLEPKQPIPEPLIRVAETRQTLQASTKTLSADNIAEPEEEVVVTEEHSPTSRSSRPGSKHTWSAKSRSQLGSIAEDRGGVGQAPQQRKKGKKAAGVNENNRGKSDWFHPFAVTCSETKSAPKMVFPPDMVMNAKELLTKLLLAVLVVEYKKPTQTYAKAFVQAKMYLEASVRYLASLGVTKKAVFALATDGVEGAILMAWCSSDSESVYIVERNVRTFNISSPIEVYHFVTVLLRLREYGDTTLKDAVEKALKAENFKQTSWNKTEQFNRMEQG